MYTHGFVMATLMAGGIAAPTAQSFYTLKFNDKAVNLHQDRDSGRSVILSSEDVALSVGWTGESPNQDFFFAPNRGVSAGNGFASPSAAAYATPVSVFDGKPSDGKWSIRTSDNNGTVTHELATAQDGFFACDYRISVDVFATVLSFGKTGLNGELPEGCKKTVLTLEKIYPA